MDSRAAIPSVPSPRASVWSAPLKIVGFAAVGTLAAWGLTYLHVHLRKYGVTVDQFLKVPNALLKWPPVVLVIVIYIVSSFRLELGKLVDRIKGIKAAGAELTMQPDEDPPYPANKALVEKAVEESKQVEQLPHDTAATPATPEVKPALASQGSETLSDKDIEALQWKFALLDEKLSEQALDALQWFGSKGKSLSTFIGFWGARAVAEPPHSTLQVLMNLKLVEFKEDIDSGGWIFPTQDGRAYLLWRMHRALTEGITPRMRNANAGKAARVAPAQYGTSASYEAKGAPLVPPWLRNEDDRNGRP